MPPCDTHLLELRNELRQKRRSVGRVLYQLGHVVNDDSSLTLDGSGSLSEATHEQWHDDRQRSGLDVLHKRRGSKLVDAVGDLRLW